MSYRKNTFSCFFIAAAGMCCTFAYTHAKADAVAQMPNQAGGMIVVTDERGSCGEEAVVVYSYAKDSRTSRGCGEAWDTRIKVTYEDGSLYTYPSLAFKFLPGKEPYAEWPKQTDNTRKRK